MDWTQSLSGIQLQNAYSEQMWRKMAKFIVQRTVEYCSPKDWKFGVEATIMCEQL